MLLLFYGFFATVNSVDPPTSAFALWGYAGLAALFWAIRDWVKEDPKISRKLLWWILLNAAVIGVVALFSRVTNSREVLWLYQPEVTSRYYIFGPFEYRATASQFFNMLWPAAAGLYLHDRAARISPAFPVSALILLAACPIITSSRGGMLMFALGCIILGAALILSRRISIQPTRLIFIALAIFAIFAAFGIQPVQKRWRESRSIQKFLDLSGRLHQNENSWRIIADHPWQGVGPGAYEPAFRLYGFKNAFKPDRDDPRERKTWEFFYAKAHNDWLQILAEWGVPGALLIVVTLLIAGLSPYFGRTNEPLLHIGIGSGLLITVLHAAFDYPLQNFAILTHFVALLALNSIGGTTLLSAAQNTPPSDFHPENRSQISVLGPSLPPPAASDPSAAGALPGPQSPA